MTTKFELAQNNPFERMRRSFLYKNAKPTEKLVLLLQFKPFEQLLKDGDLFDVQGASQRSGYTPQHVRRLCREERLDHLTRGLNDAEVHFYFLPEQLEALFTYKKAKA